MGKHKIGIRRVNVEKILLAAEKIFAEKGYGSTAMADIAAEVQLPRSTCITTSPPRASCTARCCSICWKCGSRMP